MSGRKSDNDLLTTSSEQFIPIACHYNKNTLLTKNGELIQILEINGINSDKISQKLFNLRDSVRKAIAASVDSNNFAFWIHTIRRKANLDDDTPYNSFLSANIHDIWCKKNYWDDKFVNRLYITIIHTAKERTVRNLKSLAESLLPKSITESEKEYLEQSIIALTSTTDKIFEYLSEFGVAKLGIRYSEENCYSEMVFLYRRIMQLSEDTGLLPIADISSDLASHEYAVGSDKLEVTGSNGKKFAAIMSIKEYQEVSSEALDRFLQEPVEMICTEVFYFISRSEIIPIFEDQGYIMRVSGDKELLAAKGIGKILSSDPDNSKNNFCHQQISIMVIGDDLSALDQQVKHASEHLSQIGIVHVREDINLEKTFWSQLPGNFSFLSRMLPTVLENTSALASLHNYPTGNQYSPWGRALTLLRTEKGTPYFMNFHDNFGVAKSCIFGSRNSGKTTLLNFFLSEADKYDPTIFLITNNDNSKIFVKSKNGRYFHPKDQIINPLLLEYSEDFIAEFIKIIANHYIIPLSEETLDLIQDLSGKAMKLPVSKKKLSSLIALIKDSDKGAVELRERIKIYDKGGLYHGVFESEEALDFEDGDLISFNFGLYDDNSYIKENYPKEKKLVEQFEYDLNTRRSLKAAAILALHHLFKQQGDNPKIFAIDSMDEVLNLKFFSGLVQKISDDLQHSNEAFVTTVNIESLFELFNIEEKSQDWISNLSTSFILPPEIRVTNLEKILQINQEELYKLYDLIVSSRTFLIKQDEKTIASELSIGGLPGIMRILSAREEEIKIYQKIIKEYGDKKPEDWVEHFYNTVAVNNG
jgi:type IV secretion system protein VirB4